MTKNQFGVWEVNLPAKEGQPAIPHNTKVKVLFISCIKEPKLTSGWIIDLHDHSFG